MKQPSIYLKMKVLGAIDVALGKTRDERVRNVAAMTFLDEEANQYRFTWRTIQTWYYRYKNHGVIQLLPHQQEIHDTLERLGLAHSTFTSGATELMLRTSDGVLRRCRNLCLSAMLEAVRASSGRTIEIDIAIESCSNRTGKPKLT